MNEPTFSPTIPEITLLLCTYNPRWDILQQVMDALAAQTLDKSRWELLVVDNNSKPQLELSQFQKWPINVRMIREPKPGVPRGRSAGVDVVKAPLILMLDDDNILDPDYLQAAVEIAGSEPTFGAFGGVARPFLEIERAQPWQKKVFPYLAIRDYGTSPITSNEDRWGEWEPIGAGMIVRTDVARKFADYVRNNQMAATMDRRGKSLLSGYDSLLARCSYRLGYYNSYQPRLKLTHFIKRPRLKFFYLVKLLYGHGRSIVMLNTILGKPSDRLSFKELFGRFVYRSGTNGLGGAIIWMWDLGYFVECRAAGHTPAKSGT